MRRWGQEGQGDGDLNDPGGVVVVGDSVFVCDYENNRVQGGALDGKFVRSFGRHGKAEGEFNGPHCIAAAGD